MFVSGVGDC